MKRPAGLCAALLVGSLLAGVPAARVAASPAACPNDGQTIKTPENEGQSPTLRPVVLVHGWIGDPMTETASRLRQRLGDRISTFTFDYRLWALHWASDPHIAACLADYVNGVSQAHTGVGGDGKVVVVAHSMGGLAMRYAMDSATVPSPVPATTVPQVITLGTPHLGSPWGGTVAADWLSELMRSLGRDRPPHDAAGGRCLSRHDRGRPLPDGCGPLPPYLLAGVTVTQVAGDITVDRTLFGFTLYSLPLFTDGIVPVPSAHGYATSGDGGSSPPGLATSRSRTDSCRVDFGKLYRPVPQWGFLPQLPFDYLTLRDLQEGQQTAPVLGLAGAAMLLAPCGHLNLPVDRTALDQISEVITALPATAGTRPQPTDGANVVRFDGIGEFTLRLTASDLLSRGYVDEGNLYQGANATCVRYAKDGESVNFSVESATGRVLAIGISSVNESPQTQIGHVRSGSTLGELRRAFTGYRVDEYLNLDFGQGTNGVIVSGDGGAIAFSLEDAPDADYKDGTAKVTHINGVGLPGFAPTNAENGC